MRKKKGQVPSQQASLFNLEPEYKPEPEPERIKMSTRPQNCCNYGLYPDSIFRCIVTLESCPPDDGMCADYTKGHPVLIGLGGKKLIVEGM